MDALALIKPWRLWGLSTACSRSHAPLSSHHPTLLTTRAFLYTYTHKAHYISRMGTHIILVQASHPKGFCMLDPVVNLTSHYRLIFIIKIILSLLGLTALGCSYTLLWAEPRTRQIQTLSLFFCVPARRKVFFRIQQGSTSGKQGSVSELSLSTSSGSLHANVLCILCLSS